MWRRVGLVVSAALLLASCGSGGGDVAPGRGSDEQAEAPRSAAHEHHHHHGARGPAGHRDCLERGHGPRPEARPVRPAEITQASREALRALARESERLPCGAVAEWALHVRNHAHGVAPPERTLAGRGGRRLLPPAGRGGRRQWRLGHPRAGRGGRLRPVVVTGAGRRHPLDQLDAGGRALDPTRPSMLLFDETAGRPPRLVGFSYWVRSASEPEGFAGANDAWHSHLGLCFVRGRLYLEGVPAALACPGTWLNGGDLWMLHAWVVPDLPNPDGRFAPANPAVP